MTQEDKFKTEKGEDKAWRTLAEMDPHDVTRRSLARFDPATGLYSLDTLGRTYAIDPGNRSALSGKLTAHPICQKLEIGLAVFAPRNAGLVGDNHDEETGFCGGARKLENAVLKDEIGAGMDIVTVNIDDPVPIQKKRALQGFGPVHPSGPDAA